MTTNSMCYTQCADMPSPITEMAKDPAGCPERTSAAVTDKQCTKNAPEKYSYFTCSDDQAGRTGDNKPTDKPSTGAECSTSSQDGYGTPTICLKDTDATQEDYDKKGEGSCNTASWNPNRPCSVSPCRSRIVASKCDSIPLQPTAYRIKTTEDLKDVLPPRPINPMYFVYAGVALLVIIIIVCVVCKPCSSKAPAASGEAPTAAKAGGVAA
jgi:hypothetical protein